MQTTLLAYQARIHEALTRDQLRIILRAMDPSLVADTLPMVEQMSEADFGEWRTGWDQCAAGAEPREWWVDKYLDILIPPPVAKMQVFLQGDE